MFVRQVSEHRETSKQPVEEFIADQVTPGPHGYGGDVTAMNQAHLRNLTGALGRLVNLLAECDVLDADDIGAIIGQYDMELELSEE